MEVDVPRQAEGPSGDPAVEGPGRRSRGEQLAAAAVATHLDGSRNFVQTTMALGLSSRSVFPQCGRGAQEHSHRVQVGTAGGRGGVVKERRRGGWMRGCTG